MSNAAAESSEFNQLFKDDFARMFSAPALNAEKIKSRIFDMVQYISRGIRFPRRGLRADLEHDVYQFALEIVSKENVDASQNPAAYLRTSINRQFIARLDFYDTTNADPTDFIVQAQCIDPAEFARKNKNATDYTISHPPSKVILCRGIDQEIESLTEKYRASNDYEVLHGLEAAVFALQKMRMRFAGEYFCCLIGNRRFSATSFSMCAPKGE